jgi:predicted transcriptional regulator
MILGIDVQKKPIRLTKHAVQRALKYDLASELIERMIWEGERQREGKTKAKYVLKTKNGVWVAVCEVYPDQIIVITIMKGR